MDMSADFLTRFSRTEDSDYWNSRFLLDLRRFDIISQDRVELRRRSLVVVHTVQPDSEKVHHCQNTQSDGREVSSPIIDEARRKKEKEEGRRMHY